VLLGRRQRSAIPFEVKALPAASEKGVEGKIVAPRGGPHPPLAQERKPHPFAGSVRYHLGLRTPNCGKCWIEVDGIRYSWRDCEAVLFDETYIHEAKNETDVDRLILFCDVERPLKGMVPRAINRFIINNVVRITASQNVEGEPIGLANRLFGILYRFHLLSKRVKQWNRKVYYGFKYTAMILVLYAIFFG
jgi:beta-hydroxylase